jgi:hypothetical protein
MVALLIWRIQMVEYRKGVRKESDHLGRSFAVVFISVCGLATLGWVGFLCWVILLYLM